MLKYRSISLILVLCLLAGIAIGEGAWGRKKEEPAPGETPAETAPSQQEETAAPQAPADAPDPGKQALELYNRGVELFQIGQVQAEKGNRNGQKDLLRQAIRNFEEAVTLDPTLVDAQSNIGFAYLTLEERKKAIREFQKALQIHDKHLNTLNGLSTAYALDGRIDDSLATFETLTTLDPGNPQYFFNKGSVLQKAGRFSDAAAAYREALRLDPKEQRSLFNMGTLLENQGQFEEALGFYRQAKDVSISNPIGLESVHRIQYLEADLAKQAEANPEKAQPEGGTP